VDTCQPTHQLSPQCYYSNRWLAAPEVSSSSAFLSLSLFHTHTPPNTRQRSPCYQQLMDDSNPSTMSHSSTCLSNKTFSSTLLFCLFQANGRVRCVGIEFYQIKLRHFNVSNPDSGAVVKQNKNLSQRKIRTTSLEYFYSTIASEWMMLLRPHSVKTLFLQQRQPIRILHC